MPSPPFFRSGADTPKELQCCWIGNGLPNLCATDYVGGMFRVSGTDCALNHVGTLSTPMPFELPAHELSHEAPGIAVLWSPKRGVAIIRLQTGGDACVRVCIRTYLGDFFPTTEVIN